MAGTAVIDWFSFTFEGWSDMGEQGVGGMVRAWLREWIGNGVGGESANGLHGFEHSVHFTSINDQTELVPIGVCAWGGKNQRGKIYVSINGTGCSLIRDWESVRKIVEAVKGTITRVDVAVDAMNGEFTTDDAVGWYKTGGFNAGGRRPNYKMEGDWSNDPDMCQRTGRTFYVGRRQNGKYARVYEKGKQLGDQWSVWNRFEVEVHNVDRVIPLDVITDPGPYFVGMYPCCEAILPHGAKRIATLSQEFEITLDRLKNFMRISYGKCLHVLRIMKPDDDAALVDELCQKGIPRRLGKAALTALKARQSSSPQSPGAMQNG